MLAEEAIFANDAYYLAFQHRDFAAMEALWAKIAAVVCIHPGWPPLTQRDDIVLSWRQILANENQPEVMPRGPRAFINGDTALVVCYETVEGGALVATNGFLKESGEMRIFHHQASHCAMPVGVAEDEGGAVN
jgi:hypothetical protein